MRGEAVKPTEQIVQFDSKTISLAAAALASVLASPLAAGAGPAPAPEFTAEKCYGIAAAGQNDCQTSTHSCAGEAKQARERDSWIYVPAGTCAKIDGGSLKRG
jgi:uncharacterized membrane protein